MGKLTTFKCGVTHRKTWIPFQKKEVHKFMNDIPHAKVIEILDGHHYCFIAQVELIYDEMKKFLLTDSE